MRKKARREEFELALAALRASGFEVRAYEAIEEGVLASRDGCGAVIAPDGAGHPRIAVGAGKLIGGELARLVDHGYQKFLRVFQDEWPATARDLQGIHQFGEELKQLTGVANRMNESLGTTSDVYLYDRLQGRKSA